MMSKMKTFLGLILSLMLFSCSAVGCVVDDPTVSVPSDSSTPSLPEGEAPWEGNWDGPEIDEGEQVCQQKCNVCEKCLNNVTDACVDEEYCSDLNGRTKYVFNAIDEKVKKVGNLTIEQTWVGNMNATAGTEIVFMINAAEDTVVTFGATLSRGPVANVANSTPIYVNGERIRSRGGNPQSYDWYNFDTIWLGCITLKEGANEIKLTNPNGNNAYNVKDFTFLSSVELELLNAVHECSSKNEQGLCTDYDCNELVCLNKDETGWKQLVIDGGDPRVEKYVIVDGEKQSLWKESESCIGDISNSVQLGLRDQTIIWAFEATEETYVRVSLNTSTKSQGTSYKQMYDITLNGETIETEAVSGSVSSGAGWGTYVDGTVAYIKASSGRNVIKFVHKYTNLGDNIKYMTLSYEKGTLTTTYTKEIQVPVESVSVSAENDQTTVLEDATLQLTATVSPEDATLKDVSYVSSDPTVASVDSKGLVTGLKVGTATITVTTLEGSKTATIDITVESNGIEDYYFEGEEAAWTGGSLGELAMSTEAGAANGRNGTAVGEVNENIGAKLTYTINASKAATAEMYLCGSPRKNTTSHFTLKVNGESVETIGTMTGTGGWHNYVEAYFATIELVEGENVIELTVAGPCGNYDYMKLTSAAELAIAPLTVAVESVTLSSANNQTLIEEGDTLQLTATVMPEDATNKKVSYTSSDETIATVDENGLVTALKAGSVTITATTVDGAKTATIDLTVEEPAPIVVSVESVTLVSADGQTVMKVGGTLQLTATVLPENATNKKVKFTSSDETIASVDANGLVTALKVGSVTITATSVDGEKTATIDLTVDPVAVESVTLVSANDQTLVKAGATLQLTATVLPENATNKNVNFTSSDETIATVDENGLVTALKAGSVTITATTEDGAKTATIELTVIETRADYYFEGEEAAWTDGSLGAIAMSTESGAANGRNGTVVGNVNENIGATLTYTIYASKAASAEMYLCGSPRKNTTSHFTLKVNGESAKTIETMTGTGGWHNYVEAYFATIDLVEGKNVIELTVAGACGNYDYMKLASAAELTLAPLTVAVESITLSSADNQTVIEEGDTLQLTATVLPEDATNKKVNFTSSDETVATVDENGLVTALKAGSVTITATTEDGAKTATIDLTVEEPAPIVVSVESVTLVSANDQTLVKVGETLQLTATVSPENATNKKVNFTSSDETVATVDGNGLVTTLKVGSVTITATTVDGEKTATIEITVDPVAVESVTLVSANDQTLVKAGATLQLTATVSPENATNKNVNFTSSDETVATVDVNGLVTALKAGSVTITATTEDGEKTATIELTVEADYYFEGEEALWVGGSLGEITMSTESGAANGRNGTVVGNVNLNVGAKLIYTINASKAASAEMYLCGSPRKTTTSHFTLKVNGESAETIASMAGTGGWHTYVEASFAKKIDLVEGKNVIELTVTGACGNYDYMKLTSVAELAIVSPVAVESVTVSSADNQTVIKEGDTLQLTATVLPEDATYKKVNFTSSDETIATVDENGLVTALKVGNVTITATTVNGAKTATIEITVDPVAVESVTLVSADNQTLVKVGATLQLTATVLPENATNKNVNFTSSDETVATVDENGLVTALKVGSVTITATTEDGEKTATIDLTAEPVSVESVTLSSADNQTLIKEGDKLQLTATVLPENATNKKVNFTSSDETVATVDENGLVTTLKVGNVTITVTTEDGAKTATIDLTVDSVSVESVTLVSANDQTLVKVGETLQLTATVLPENATNKKVNFTSSDETVATVDGNGLVTTLKVGSVTITATTEDGAKTATIEITVDPVAVESVTLVSADNQTLVKAGATLQLTATVSPENATNKNVNFTSSDEMVATVDGNGLVTALKAGSVTITATTEDGEKTAEIELTVEADYYFEGEEALWVGGSLGAIAMSTESGAANGRNGTVVGEVNLNIGAKLIYIVNASKAASAEMYLCGSPRNTTTSHFTLKVNGESAETITSMAGTGGWHTYVEASFATINLVEGKNVIELTVAGACGNYDYMKLTSVAELEIASPAVAVESVALSAENNVTTITEVGSVQLNAVITPATADVQYVTYTSSDKTIATVDVNGLVTALKAGSVTITVTTADGKKTATIDITVEELPNEALFEGESATWTDGTLGAISAMSSANATNGTALGGINENKTATLTYKINASEATTAKVYLCMTLGGRTTKSNVFSITVNGVAVSYQTSFKASSWGWGNFEEFYFATIDLAQGENTIVLTVTGSCGNYDYMKLASAAELTLVSEE